MLQENKIKVGKYNINYLKVGNGAHHVLCLPGTAGSIWSDFKPQVEGFDREKFCLVVWEAPGFGKSRPPEREFHTDYYGQDVDIVHAFMKALNIPKFSLMGWCYGGVSSVMFAAKYPEAVNKLVVWGARTCLLQHELEIYIKLKDTRLWSEKMRKPRIQLYGEERFTQLCLQVINALETFYHAKNGEVLSPQLLKNVRCPTFILHGEKDAVLDKANLYDLHSNIRGSRIHLYPEGKHNIHLKYSEDFNQRVQEFLLQD